MSSNIKVIRFTAIMSAIFAILTYFVALNISYQWFDIKWLSNSFLLTIFGGAFASMLVVLICEIQKYWQSKKEIESAIFFHLSFVYGQLYIIQYNLNNQLKNKNQQVYEHLIKGNLINVQQSVNIITSLGYVTFSRKNKLFRKYEELCKWLTGDLSEFIREGAYLEMAINTDQINNLQAFQNSGIITANSPYTGKVLTKLNQRVRAIIDIVSSYIESIDESCKHQFNWELKKASIEKVTDIEFGDLGTYIHEEN